MFVVCMRMVVLMVRVMITAEVGMVVMVVGMVVVGMVVVLITPLGRNGMEEATALLLCVHVPLV